MGKNKNKEKPQSNPKGKGNSIEMQGAGDNGKMSNTKGQTSRKNPAGTEFYS